MVELSLIGPFPSKKNAWRHAKAGRVYLPAQQQADIDALVIQAQSAKRKIDRKFITELVGKRLKVMATFRVQNELKDLDNVFTTILDVLQKAGIIENDRLVRSFKVDEYSEYGAGAELVDIIICAI